MLRMTFRNGLWKAGHKMEKLEKFGNALVFFNVFYCLYMATANAFKQNQYVFISEYFFSAAILVLVWFAVQKRKKS